MNMHAPALSFMRDPQPAAGLVAAVREEALRALADLAEAMPLTAWRGRSGRRYVVSVHACDAPPPMEGGGVLLAITRDRDGSARLLGSIGLAGPVQCDGEPVPENRNHAAGRADALGNWCEAMRARGACEWHLHLLARSVLAQEAMRADLACLPRTTG